MKKRLLSALALCTLVNIFYFIGCASKEYKNQPLGSRQTSRVLEYDYEVVWKAIQDALAEFKIEKSNTEEGVIETQWAYTTSSQKYLEVKVNNLPRRKYLQSRYKYTLRAKKEMMGVLVEVNSEEEIEKLNNDGTFDRWVEVDEASEADTHRAHQMLENIQNKVLSGRNI